MKRLALLACLGLAGCIDTIPVSAVPGAADPSELNDARALVTYDFFDPTTPLFRNEMTYALENGEKVICGQVNAKNRLGAYVGFTPFYVRYGIEGGRVVARMVRTDVGATMGCNQLRDKGMIALPNPT